MSGKTKQKYNHENILISKEYTKLLNNIFILLPKNYDKKNILEVFQEMYPFHWNRLVERQRNYQEKDAFLISKNKRTRYNSISPENYFFNLQKVKHLLSKGSKEKHLNIINSEDYEVKKYKVINKCEKANEKMKNKILEAKINSQNVEPKYLKNLMRAYHKEKLNTEQKLIILNELTRFDVEEVTRFFYKINDSEKNNILREFSFYHLQKYGHYVKLRKRFRGNTKSYQNAHATLEDKTPEDLYNLLITQPNIACQKYDYFISHSSKDKNIVREVIKEMNEKNKVCYCDWSLDNAFLKRELANNYTRETLKLRMEQSEKLILINTKNSEISEWVLFELVYFKKLNKDILIFNEKDKVLETCSLKKVGEIVESYKFHQRVLRCC
ncbi:TIR domain-containing protein [Macrococcus brunensis]|uniref:TIR domain-containing protein n=1 Tax=Macrococcus brunensis TaxID=198483 RepID=UPI001EEFBA7A|nr:TIR domain-containing protein [Macrococcus brunensis]ULG71495.1 toll/interleukin-1 receptor domain-containing protein [Macrococcus brunensis]